MNNNYRPQRRLSLHDRLRQSNDHEQSLRRSFLINLQQHRTQSPNTTAVNNPTEAVRRPSQRRGTIPLLHRRRGSCSDINRLRSSIETTYDELPSLPFNRQQQQHPRHSNRAGPQQARRVSYTAPSSNERLQQQSQAGAHHPHSQQQQSSLPQGMLGFRPDYVLGKSLLHPTHMIVPRDDTQALEVVNTLSKHDFAWVKRSDGTYTYAILANRTTGQEGYAYGSTNEEVMVFVIDESGSTKNIRKKYWCEYIRLVSMQGMTTTDIEEKGIDPAPPIVLETRDHVLHNNQDIPNNTLRTQNGVVLCQEIPVACQEIHRPPQVNSIGNQIQDDGQDEEEDTAPLPDMITCVPKENEEECSLISSVSDRARGLVWRG